MSTTDIAGEKPSVETTDVEGGSSSTDLLGRVELLRADAWAIAREYRNQGDVERYEWIKENVTPQLWALQKGIPFRKAKRPNDKASRCRE